ncbi:E3 ubiquitin-protein ligase Topors [Gastrophryne carolinensis]
MREKRTRRRRAARADEAAAGSTMQSTSADDFLGASSSKSSSRKAHSKGSPTDVSPDSKCPICLDRFENISHLDRCLHRFCFKCIKEWAKNKAECPLCKQPFHSILHSVRAEDDFKEYVLRPTLNGSFASPDGQRFRYRTTMTRDNTIPTRTLRSSVQRTFTPPDNGILFEGFTNLQPSRGSNIQQMMRRLASRRQASAEGRAMRQIQEQELINFRRALYRSGVRVRSIQDGGRYRDISAEFFRRNSACLHRLVPWLKRELTVLFGTHGSLVNIVQHIIMSNVTRYDMESQAFLEDLRPFLLHRTEHFIHEFINFARCPYNMDAYDQHANYDCPAPSYEEGSDSESSVITISPDESNARDHDVSSSVQVGLAPWDDETPGPSYSTVEQATTNLLNMLDSSDEERSSSRSASIQIKSDDTDALPTPSMPTDDCVIVGYVKPLAERTPELVELSSDSEPSLCEVKIEKPNKPQEIPLILSGSSDSHRSSSTSSSFLSDKRPHKSKHKRKTSSKESHSKKKKEKRSTNKSSRGLRESRKNEGYYNEDSPGWRERSWSSDCYSRSSRNKTHESHRKADNKGKQTSKTRDKKNTNWRQRRRSRSTDRSWSWRSRTVSLSSESSRERIRSRSRNRKRYLSRSRSRDSFDVDDFRSTYQWEYTYYSRNHDREEFKKSYKKHSRGRGNYSKSPTRQERYLQTFSLRKDSRKERASDRRRHRSRSHSSGRPATSSSQKSQSDKPSGKRKYKSRHLEPQSKKESNRDTEVSKRKEDHCMLTGLADCEDDLSDKSSYEPKQKIKKKTRSPSVEIVFEGKCTQEGKHHKKKKKKHKKKRKHKPSSPVVIRIDSDSDTLVRPDVPSSTHKDTLPGKSKHVETKTDLPSGSQNTSASLNTTEAGLRTTSPFSQICDLPSINEHLDTATGILDGLHFGESFDGQAFLPPKTPSPFAETALPEITTSDSKSGHNSEGCLTPPVTPNSRGILAESSPESFPDPFGEPLEDLPSTSPPVTTAPQEHVNDNSPDSFAETIERLEELLSPAIL